MKKICLVLLFAIIGSVGLNAQGNTSFGVTGGGIYGKADLSLLGLSSNQILDVFDIDRDDLEVLDGGGFYLGFLADIGITEKLSIQPEALYANVGGESLIVIPIMAKYYVAEQFNLQVGPQFDFALDIPQVADEFIKKSGFSLAFGAGYDFSETFALQAKYSVGLNNRLDRQITDLVPDFLDIIGDTELKVNTFQIGIVYKFQ